MLSSDYSFYFLEINLYFFSFFSFSFGLAVHHSVSKQEVDRAMKSSWSQVLSGGGSFWNLCFRPRGNITLGFEMSLVFVDLSMTQALNLCMHLLSVCVCVCVRQRLKSDFFRLTYLILSSALSSGSDFCA